MTDAERGNKPSHRRSRGRRNNVYKTSNIIGKNMLLCIVMDCGVLQVKSLPVVCSGGQNTLECVFHLVRWNSKMLDCLFVCVFANLIVYLCLFAFLLAFGWLVGWLVGRSFGWSVGRLVGWLAVRLDVRSFFRSFRLDLLVLCLVEVLGLYNSYVDVNTVMCNL